MQQTQAQPNGPGLRGESARFLLPLLIILLASTVLSACSDTPTSTDGARLSTSPIGGLTVTACQYGGFYPDCNPPPDAPVTVNPNPINLETQQQCNYLLEACAGGGEGGTGDVPPDTTEDCQHTWDRCKQSLTSRDSASLRSAAMRRRTAFSDTTAAAICPQLAAQFDLAFAEGKVFRGNPALPDSGTAHNAQSQLPDPEIHIDGDYLDAAADPSAPNHDYLLRRLAGTTLHEAAHLLGYGHLSTENNGTYTSFPFNYTNGGPGVTELCVTGL